MTPNKHPSIQRLRRIQQASRPTDHRSPFKVLQQASASYQDFVGAYGGTGDPLADTKLLQQADLDSSGTGVLNRLFGPGLWAQLHTGAAFFDALPKVQLGQGVPLGWRAKTAFASTGKGGQSEGTVPTAVTSTYAEISPTPKETTIQMRVSGMLQDLQNVDDAYGALAEINQEAAIEHAKEIERALTEDIDTLASNNLESLDRVSASQTNESAIGWTAGDDDIFGIDRGANSWANAQQDRAGTARTLTTKLVDSIFRKVIARQGQPTWWGTGYDTWEALADLYEARMRTQMDNGFSSNGQVGDAEAADGMAISTFVGQIHGRPIVLSDQAHADSSELSRLYLFDVSNPEGMNRPRLGMDIVTPTQTYMAGEKSNRSPQSISFMGDSVLLSTRAELGCRRFDVQGQLGDTTAP